MSKSQQQSPSMGDAGATEKPQRQFIAFPLPAEAQAGLGELLRRLQTGARFTTCRPSWTAPETLHVTLAFLGPQPLERIAPFTEAIQSAVEGLEPLRIEVKQLGVFPDWRRPRVLWAGVRDRSHQLAPLVERLWQRLAAFGWSPDKPEFSPHLTLARFKSLTGTAALEPIVRAHGDFHFEALLDQVVLFRSELLPTGAVHTPLARVPLVSARAHRQHEGEPRHAA